MALGSKVLYQNKDHTVALLDIPKTISLGQVLPEQQLERTLLSSSALQEPYPSTEPKSDAESTFSSAINRTTPEHDSQGGAKGPVGARGGTNA